MAEGESKAQERAVELGADDSESSVPMSSQLSSPALSAISIPWSELDAPHLNMNPPDYATATATRPNSSVIHRPVALFPPPAAQRHSMSMSDTVAHPDEETGLITASSKPERRQRCRTSWYKPSATCNMVLGAAVVFLIIVLSQVVSSKNDPEPDSKPPKMPGNSENDGNDKDRGRTPIRLPYFPNSRCTYQHCTDSEYIGFHSPRNFTFTEFMEQMPLSQEVKGTVYVQPSDQLDEGIDIRLRIAYATTSQLRVSRSNYIMEKDSFALKMPDCAIPQGPASSKSCLGVFVGIEVRQGIELENWGLLTGNLDIVVAEGLFDGATDTEQQLYVTVHGTSIFSATNGSGEIAYWSSRRTIIEFLSGTIRGAFALRDLLHLKTVSGNIEASVDPKPADPDRVVPAEFVAASTSGSINVQYPTMGDKLPPRDFQTRLETVSSSISGTYIVGTSFSARTISGDIHAQLLPLYTDKQPSTLETHSKSGKTTLVVQAPFPRDSWPHMRSGHRSTSTSGSIDISYPPQWEGGIDAQPTSGSITITGKYVEIIDERRGPGQKRTTARKGDGSGDVRLETVSGDIGFRVDDE